MRPPNSNLACYGIRKLFERAGRSSRTARRRVAPPPFAQANHCHNNNSIPIRQPTHYDVSVPGRLVVSLVFFLAGIAQAAIVRFELEKVPAADRDPNVPASYEMLRGKIHGELDPLDRRNAIIQDVRLAPLNTRGRVEYITTFTIYRPAAGEKRSGVLVYEVVNRGASIARRDYTTGDIFLQSGWQGDLPFGGKATNGSHGETIQVPAAHNPDGTSVTGPVLARFANARQGTTTLPLGLASGYASSGTPPHPVTTDTRLSSLTTHTFEDIRGTVAGIATIAPQDWAWADCTETPFPGNPDPAKLCVRGGFRQDLLYQLQYTARDPLILGIGLAAVRDVVTFFHENKQDDQGTPNPIAGQIRHVIGLGISQSGNFVRTFLNLGFNESEQGHRVWDGAMPIIAARQTPLNLRFAVPGGASNLYEPGSDGTVWWAHWPDTFREHAPAGLLDRCLATNTCPKVVEVMGSSEFYALRASPDYVGTSGAADIPLPSNVRRYYVASTQHGGGPGGFQWTAVQPQRNPGQGPIEPASCALPSNPNPMNPILRALLASLREWVIRDRVPPASLYPRLADGTLIAEADLARQFPFIPGVPSPEGVANPTLFYNFGTTFQAADLSGSISTQPPQVTGVVPTYLPAVDSDGNERVGVQTVLGQAPLGTYLGWNITASGFDKGKFCSLTGSYVPFAGTKQERLASHDPRPSLQERYGTHEAYVKRVREAAEKSVKAGFLLPDDAARLVGEAEKSDVLRNVTAHD